MKYTYLFTILFLLIFRIGFSSNIIHEQFEIEESSSIKKGNWQIEIIKELEEIHERHDVRGKTSLFLSDVYIKGLEDIEKNNEKAEEFNEKAMSRSLKWAMILYFVKGKSDEKYTEYTQYLNLYGGLERIEKRFELLFQGILENRIDLIFEAIMKTTTIMNNYIKIFPSDSQDGFEAIPFFKEVREPFLFYEELEESESDFLQVMCKLFKFGKKSDPKIIDPILETDMPDICKVLSSSLCFVPVSKETYEKYPCIHWEKHGGNYLKFPFRCFDMEMCLYRIQEKYYAGFTWKGIETSNKIMKTFYKTTLKDPGKIDLLDLQRGHFEQSLETFSESKRKAFLENEEFGDVKYELVENIPVYTFSFARVSTLYCDSILMKRQSPHTEWQN